MSVDDPFADYGDERGAKPRPTNYRREALLRRQEEIHQLGRAYRQQKEKMLEEALRQGPGERFAPMLAWVKTLGIDDAAQLVQTVSDERWLWDGTPEGFRHAVLHLIGLEIERIRKAAKLPRFDDDMGQLSDGEETAFFAIKKILNL